MHLGSKSRTFLMDITRERARSLKQRCEELNQVSENEGRLLTEEEQTEYDATFEELRKTQDQIRRMDELAEMDASLSEPASPPVGPSATMAPVQARAEEASVRMGKDRESERGFDSLGEQLAAIAHASRPESRYDDVDKRLHFLQERGGNPNGEVRQSGASELIDSDGGYLVQTDFSESIGERVYSTGQVASRVTRTEVGPNANGLTYNTIDETSRANGSRFGGVRAYWTAEAAALTGSKPTFAQQTLTLKKLTALFYATEELLMDQSALAGLVERVVPQELAFKLEDSIINGTGSGQPLGILNSPAEVSQAKKSGQAATTVVTDNVEKMWARMWAPSRANAVWFVNQDVEPELSNMADANGNALYMPPLGLSDTPFSRLFNRPVVPIEYCATLGTVGDIILADMSQYQMITKQGVRSDSSMHVRYLFDERAFRWMMRCDGQSMWNSALTPFKGSNTQSPFITLATRS